MNYHCPSCGEPLTQIKRDIQAEQDALMEAWAEQDYEGDPPPDPDESEHWACTNLGICGFASPLGDVLNGKGLYFNVHQQLGDYTSKPGDSWSISWVK